MKKILLSFLFAALFVSVGQAQIKLSWQLLSDVEFKEKYFEEVGDYYLYPEFGEAPKAFEGQEVLISGYMIPVDPEGNFFVLSKGPYASCFFCGQAGPETIVQLEFKDKDHRKYKMDEKLTFKGILKLNNTDVNLCNYILLIAEEQ